MSTRTETFVREVRGKQHNRNPRVRQRSKRAGSTNAAKYTRALGGASACDPTTLIGHQTRSHDGIDTVTLSTVPGPTQCRCCQELLLLVCLCYMLQALRAIWSTPYLAQRQQEEYATYILLETFGSACTWIAREDVLEHYPSPFGRSL